LIVQSNDQSKRLHGTPIDLLSADEQLHPVSAAKAKSFV
jgi:hypothetical protein